jgi:DNA-binding HxlR family transcriptional regulator
LPRPSFDDDGGSVDRRNVAEVLRLLGAGAPGSILLALGDGPLRTKELTRRVSGYAPRTVYRHVAKLVEIEAVDREDEPGVPSKVVYRLADPCGIDLYELVDAYTRVSLDRLPDGGVIPHSWGSLTLLADLWESGMFGALNIGPCAVTELTRVGHDLSFHQVSRRAILFVLGGMIRETQDGRKRRRYELTEKARQATALIAGLGRWRERHAVPAGEPGLTAVEAAELLLAALPLVILPEHAGKRFKLAVGPPERSSSEGGEVVWAKVETDGAVVGSVDPSTQIDGWGRGEVGDWIEALLQGASNRVRAGGDGPLIRTCMRGMHEGLWKRQEPRTD